MSDFESKLTLNHPSSVDNKKKGATTRIWKVVISSCFKKHT